MISKGKYLIFLIVFFSCSEKQGVEERIGNSNDSSKLENGNDKILDTLLYIRTGNPDTALVFSLHHNLNTMDYENFISYCRLCNEDTKILSLYRSIFSSDKNVNEQIERIRTKKSMVLDSTRNLILKDFKEFGYFDDSPEVDWMLFKCKDKYLIEYIENLLANKNTKLADKTKIKKDLEIIHSNKEN